MENPTLMIINNVATMRNSQSSQEKKPIETELNFIVVGSA